MPGTKDACTRYKVEIFWIHTNIDRQADTSTDGRTFPHTCVTSRELGLHPTIRKFALFWENPLFFVQNCNYEIANFSGKVLTPIPQLKVVPMMCLLQHTVVTA